MKAKEKRNNHSYKASDKIYQKAMRRAKKEKKSLSTQIEEWIKYYADGWNISAVDYWTFEKNGEITKQTI